MLVLGIDIETGSKFDTPKNETIVTEIGAVLWDTNLNCPVMVESLFVNEDREVHPEAEKYTGISSKMIQAFGFSPRLSAAKIFDIALRADRICAHNGNEFDKPVLDGFFKRHDFGEMPGAWTEKNWIDTQSDIDFPDSMRSRNLIYLSACHGFVNPFQHRAITDTLSMLRVLSNYDIDQVVANSDSPKVKVLASVSFEQRHKAKDAGFYWDSDNKTWFRQMRQNQVEAFVASLEFKTRIVNL